MKYLVKIFVVTFFLIICTYASADQKVAFIDMTYILNNSKAGKNAQDYLKKTFEQNQKKYLDEENKYTLPRIVIKNNSERSFKVEKMISKFELDAVKNTKAKHLSGGQRKKVSIAMSLMSDPKIILMDEPFQGLDIMSTRDLQETIVNLQTEDNNRCCVISDHAARDLLAISDRAIILANKKIIAQGTPSDLIKNINAKNLYFGDAFKIN